ncbi:MAG: hypothetical protein IH987_07595 [Planctomycetes bacterium]|nr:hypothetical protein [Planctomycetota bacterium]
MTRSSKHRRRRSGGRRSSDADDRAGPRSKKAEGTDDRKNPKNASRRSGKRPVLRFVLMLGSLMVGFNACFYLWISQGDAMNAYLRFHARLVAAMLRVLGDDAAAAGKSIVSSRFSLSIEVGCDAVQASVFFILAVAVSPVSVPLLARVPYLLFGALCLSVINLFRILSLYFTGIYYPGAFEFVHIDVWQALFVFMPLVLWVAWLRKARGPRRGASNVAD